LKGNLDGITRSFAGVDLYSLDRKELNLMAKQMGYKGDLRGGIKKVEELRAFIRFALKSQWIGERLKPLR
jgi:hypothetical protein